METSSLLIISSIGIYVFIIIYCDITSEANYERSADNITLNKQQCFQFYTTYPVFIAQEITDHLNQVLISLILCLSLYGWLLYSTDMRDACKAMYQEIKSTTQEFYDHNQLPQKCLIIVRKTRHHTRCFLCDNKENQTNRIQQNKPEKDIICHTDFRCTKAVSIPLLTPCATVCVSYGLKLDYEGQMNNELGCQRNFIRRCSINKSRF
ncbi:unnamed protein product [Rotaria socialis]|uniref:Uncharacterized protein n=1 Tax=Rotaria socialis TaxID=392032 RepID=A0A820Z873_9BILA|nr:unnamed protein product [Rotaria socialis]CAF4564044.1 unnamed protein product [Rotaria socialis]CAF4892354.1 unnamed protein product [Rotaria socialis]